MAGRPRRWAAAAACAATLAVASLCYAGGGLGAAVSRRFDFGAVLTSALSIEAGGADYATRPGAVNPKVTVPYWDYTRDDATFKALYGKHTPLDARFWSLDDLWSDGWYGSAENGFHTVTAGRFAYQRVPRATSDHVANPCGYLRAPWNANARPFVTRVHQLCGADSLTGFGWPSCGTHHNLTFQSTSYYAWAWKASYGAHGPVHAAVGGTFQCKDEYDGLAAVGVLPQDVESLRVMSFVVLKSGWRAGLVEMPAACSSDAPRADCKPKCPLLEDAGRFRNISALEDMWQVLFMGARLSRSYDHDTKVGVLKAVCTTPIAPGDQLEASSPVDVSFWPVHPTLERLYMYKALLGASENATAGFDTTAWANPDGPTQYCHNNGCKGHHPYDVVPFPVHAEANGKLRGPLDGVLLAGSPSEADVTGASCDEVIATLCVLDCAVEKCADGCEAAYCAVPIAELGALLATGGVRWCYGDAPCPVGVWERDDLTVAHACPVACGRRGVACGPVCFPKPDSASWAGAHTLQGCGDVDFQIMYGGAERSRATAARAPRRPLLRPAELLRRRARRGLRALPELLRLLLRRAVVRASAPDAPRGGERSGADAPTDPRAPTRRPSAADAANSCRWADDGECDEPGCAPSAAARDCARRRRRRQRQRRPTASTAAPARGGAVAVAAVLLASAVRP
ncbi:hypothetical protein JL720_13843 [Aureococcus anophagefferens]|nr:hypothetical protein JL720_13843 [Aureococcus anophagefferens]